MKAKTEKRKWLIAPPPGGDLDTCLQNACYGRQAISKVLRYFVAQATFEFERQGLTSESGKVVNFRRKLEDIRRNLEVELSEKTLRTYIKYLDAWGYVAHNGYGRTFKVNVEKIRQAFVSPPERNERPRATRRAACEGCESGKFTTLPLSYIELQKEVISLREKVESLSAKVVNLPHNPVNLPDYVVNLPLSRFQPEGSQNGLSGTFSGMPLKYYISFREEEEGIAQSAIADPPFSPFAIDELGIGNDTLQVALGEFAAPPLAPPRDASPWHEVGGNRNHLVLIPPVAQEEPNTTAHTLPKVAPEPPVASDTPTPKNDSPVLGTQPQTAPVKQTGGVSCSQGNTGKPTGKSKAPAQTPTQVPEETEEERALRVENERKERQAEIIIQRWKEALGKPAPTNKAMLEGAKMFVEAGCDPSAEELRKCRLWHYVDNPGWYGRDGKTRGKVTLLDCAKHWEGFISYEEGQAKKSSSSNVTPISDAPRAPRKLTALDQEMLALEQKFGKKRA